MVDLVYCTDCFHVKPHAEDMTWCPKRGRVQSIGKPLECGDFIPPVGDPDMPKSTQVSRAGAGAPIQPDMLDCRELTADWPRPGL